MIPPPMARAASHLVSYTMLFNGTCRCEQHLCLCRTARQLRIGGASSRPRAAFTSRDKRGIALAQTGEGSSDDEGTGLENAHHDYFCIYSRQRDLRAIRVASAQGGYDANVLTIGVNSTLITLIHPGKRQTCTLPQETLLRQHAHPRVKSLFTPYHPQIHRRHAIEQQRPQPDGHS